MTLEPWWGDSSMGLHNLEEPHQHPDVAITKDGQII